MALLAWVLIVELGYGVVPSTVSTLVSVDIAPPAPRRNDPPPPPPPPPPPARREVSAAAAKGAPAPPGLRSEATAVIAPPVPLVLARPIAAATSPASGDAASSGVAAVVGAGQGAGGAGNGSGGGGRGGSASGEGLASNARQIGGNLPKNLTDGLLAPGDEVKVRVRYTVEPSGRVVGCRPDVPGAVPELDRRTCREIERRFRFKPARSRSNQPVSSEVVEGYVFFVREDQRAGG